MTEPICDAERQYVGSLMCHTAQNAATAAKLIEPGDLADPSLKAIYGAIVALADRGTAPCPTTVLAEIRNSGQFASAQRLQLAAQATAKIYSAVVHPAGIEGYAALVVEESLRRRTAEAGERLQQIAAVSPIEDIRQTLTEQYRALSALCQRLGDA